MSNDKRVQAAGRDRNIGVIGAGVMGRGIAQLLLQAGYRVWLHDSQAGALDRAAEFIGRMIGRQVDKGRYTESEAQTMLSGLNACGDMEELAGCHVLIEAIVELLEVKQQLFAKLEKIVSGKAILASNTSSLLVSDIASACRRAGARRGAAFLQPGAAHARGRSRAGRADRRGRGTGVVGPGCFDRPPRRGRGRPTGVPGETMLDAAIPPKRCVSWKRG